MVLAHRARECSLLMDGSTWLRFAAGSGFLLLLIGWRPRVTHSPTVAAALPGRCRGVVARRVWPPDLMLRSRELLPSVWDARSGDATEADPDATALRAALEATRRSRVCNETLLPLRLREKTFAILAHSLVNAQIYALSQPGLALRSPTLRVFGRGCPGNGTLGCFVAPLSACDARTSLTPGGAHESLDLRDRLAPLQQRLEYAIHGDRVLPAPWRHRGLFWTVSQVLAHILHPSLRTKRAVAAARRKLGLDVAPKPILALHVRNPAPCKPHLAWGRKRTCDPLSAYMPSVHRLVAKYGYGSIFVVSDDRATLREAINASALAGLHLVSALETHRPRTSRGQPLKAVRNQPLGKELGTRFMVLALLMAECEGLVGKFSSHLSRLGYALMSARHPTRDCLQPFISLDAPWCFGLNCDLANWLPPSSPVRSTPTPFDGLPVGERYVSGSMLRLRASSTRKTRRDAAPTEGDYSHRLAMAIEEFAGRTTST